MKVVFFDTDKYLRAFAKTHPLDMDVIFFKESLNQISLKKIKAHTDADIISVFAHSSMLDNQKLDLFPNLKLIATRSTGVNHINTVYCERRNINIANVPNYGAQTVAEFAFGLLLNLSRHILTARQDLTHNRLHIPSYTGFDLYGKTIGIIGTGSIGQHMIRLAKGFGMNVLAYDLFHTKTLEPLYVSFDALLKGSDIISLHIPSTPENHHILNSKAFAKMKKGVYIINTARGDLIDTSALYQALKSGVVAGIGLDVLENEDILLHDEITLKNYSKNNQVLLDSALNLKLLQYSQAIITPHIAFNTKDALERILKITFETINRFQAEIT